MATSLAAAGTVSPQAPMLSALVSQRFDSWKEIAAFFGRTTRTVQRWEMAENLPVRRHIHEKRGSIYALRSELITWRNARSRANGECRYRDRGLDRRIRLAVLPFANMSLGPQLRYFEDGLTCEIIAQLALLDPARLGVIAHTSVLSYKKSRHTIAQIRRQLKVDYILEGSVGLVGRQMRIVSHLIDVSDQTHVFADTCSHQCIDVAFLRIAIAERIARMVCQH